MKPMDLDPTLAFTALLDLDPEFGRLPVEDGAQRSKELLEAWYAQEEVRNFWQFAKQWVRTRQAVKLGAEAGRQAAQWVFDGDTPETVSRHVLTLVADGDPGELANFATPPHNDTDAEWNKAAGEAFWDEIERRARKYLGDPGE